MASPRAQLRSAMHNPLACRWHLRTACPCGGPAACRRAPGMVSPCSTSTTLSSRRTAGYWLGSTDRSPWGAPAAWGIMAGGGLGGGVLAACRAVQHPPPAMPCEASAQPPPHRPCAPLGAGTRPARLLERYLRDRRCSGTTVAARSRDSTRQAVRPAASAAPPMIAAAAAPPRDDMAGSSWACKVQGMAMQGMAGCSGHGGGSGGWRQQRRLAAAAAPQARTRWRSQALTALEAPIGRTTGGRRSCLAEEAAAQAVRGPEALVAPDRQLDGGVDGRAAWKRMRQGGQPTTGGTTWGSLHEEP